MPKNLAEIQLEHAHSFRRHQDLLRFAIPAAYFTYIAGVVGVLSSTQTDPAFPYILSAIVGFGVFLATIAEHYFYIAYRNWERHLEMCIASPTDAQAPLTTGDAVSPAKDDSNSKMKKNVLLSQVITFDQARNNFDDISRPNLAHVTMTIFLFWIAMAVALFGALFLKEVYHPPRVIQIVIVVFLVLTQLTIYKFWHSFYDAVVKRILRSLETR